MKFNKTLKFQSFVLLATRPDSFYPANFNLYWFDNKKILKAEKIKEGSIFSPEFVQVQTENLTLVITNEQIQAASENKEFKATVTDSLMPLVKEMADTKLTGLGLNLNWFILDSEISYEELTKTMFRNSDEKASSFFEGDNSRYGVYYSKQIDNDVRLKLDIKPANLFDAEQKTVRESVHFAFNFHSDLIQANQKEQVLKILSRYDEFESITKQIMDLYN